MSRRGNNKRIETKPDPRFNNLMVAKLINRCMKDGKKSVAQKEVYKAFDIIAEKTKEDPMKVYEQALDNIRPTMEVRPRRIGGAAYQVPMAVRGARKDSLAIRWLVNTSRLKSNKEFHTYAEKLAVEIMDAYKNEGGAVKKRLDIEKSAEANRAFSHFRW